MDEILNDLSEELKKAGKHQDCRKEYSFLKTDEDRVKFTMRLLRSYKKSIITKLSSKNITDSIKYREEGNRLFINPSGKPQLSKSIEMYTKSIAYAPNNSKDLALGFANRSAALFNAGLYQDCLLDIERALKLPYPNNLKAKLFGRQARCLMSSAISSQNNEIEIDKALKNTRKWLDKMDSEDQGRRIVEKILNDPKKMAKVEKEFSKWNWKEYFPTIPNDNKEIPGVSSALDIKYSEEFGKHIVATRDIEAGEILAVMKPYAHVLVPEKFYTHCSYCIEQTWSSLPCQNCVDVIYCSEKCREKAWDHHHSIECQVIGPLIALEMSNLGLLSLKLAIRAVKESGSIENLKKKTLEIDARSDLRSNGFTNGILDDKDYASVYTLTRNTEKRSLPDLFGRSLNATYIVSILATQTDLFGEKLEDNLETLEKNEWVTFIGGLIMRHQQIIPSNVHSLTEESIIGGPIERGAILMPFYSLMNHSCDPKITRVSRGRYVTLYADHSFSAGEQIFDNYGFHYALNTKNYRQSKCVQQFRFVCECIACTENWPLYGNIPSFREQGLSNQASIVYAMRNFKMYSELLTFGITNNALEMISDLNNMVKLLEANVELPCRELIEILETKKRILALLGNRYHFFN